MVSACGCTSPFGGQQNTTLANTTTIIIQNGTGSSGGSSGGSTVKAAQKCPNCGYYPWHRHTRCPSCGMVTMMLYSTVLIVENTLSMAVLGAMDTVLHVDIPNKKHLDNF
jgi:ribosomal protein S27AE